MHNDSDWILKMLQNNVCSVNFTKVDGSQRVMRCTLMPAYLPEEYKNKGQLLTEYGGSSLSVWDLEANSWRSFRVDSVRSLTIDNSNDRQMLLF